MIIIVKLIISILILLFTSIVIKLWQRRNHPPGPFPWPFIGNQLYISKLVKELGAQYLAFEELSKRYKSNVISVKLGTTDVVVVSNNDLINYLLFKEEYNSRPWNLLSQLRNMGLKKGITMNDGFEHKIFRTWIPRVLRNIGYGQQTMTEYLLSELQLILNKLKDGDKVQIMNSLVKSATINVLWTLITGKRPFHNDENLQTFMNLIEHRAKLFDLTGGLLSAFPYLRYIAPQMSGYKTLTELNKQLKTLLMNTINEHKQRYVEGNEMDFIDMFLREMSQDNKNSVFIDDNLLIILVDFFIAGISTTSPAIEFLFLQMANNQDTQRKVYEEIDRVIGSDRFPDPSDRQKMDYTEAVIAECLRIFMVFPMLGPRRVIKDTTIEGYTVPKDTMVLFNIATTNLNASLYNDPKSFKPERFLKNDCFNPDENIILFGKGKRRCPGEVLAKSAIFLFFVGVMQKYQLLPPNNQKSIKIEVDIGITIHPKPCEMLFVPR